MLFSEAGSEAQGRGLRERPSRRNNMAMGDRVDNGGVRNDRKGSWHIEKRSVYV
jgi:hypothetical protein